MVTAALPRTHGLRSQPTYARPGFLGTGTLRAFQTDPLAFMDELAREAGDVVRVRLGPRSATFLRHPDHVEHVLVHAIRKYNKRTRGYRMMRKVLGWGLVTSEGDFWRRQRRIAQPAFQRRRIAGFADAMTRATTRMLDERWDPAAAAGEPIDVSAEMARVTLEIVSETMLGIDSVTDVRAQSVGWAVPTVLEHVVHRITHALSPHEIVPTKRNRTYRRAMRELNGVVNGIIGERRRDGVGDRDDLLDMLMAAEDEETGERMTDRQLRDEVMTMYLAGHETTAVALGWTLYLLDRHPEWRDRACKELATVLGGRTPQLEDLRELDVVKRVIEESMRLYPPVWMVGRTATVDDDIGGYRNPKGRLTFLSPWLTHRDARFWPEPERFDPDRFLPERVKARPRFAYFPFSGGQRKCIGDHFAMMEAQLILAVVLSRYRPALVEGHPVVPQTAVTLRPMHGLRMHLREAV